MANELKVGGGRAGGGAARVRSALAERGTTTDGRLPAGTATCNCQNGPRPIGVVEGWVGVPLPRQCETKVTVKQDTGKLKTSAQLPNEADKPLGARLGAAGERGSGLPHGCN